MGLPDEGQPDAIILSGPSTYITPIARLYGGYKRARDFNGRASYQKDPDQGDSGFWGAFIYWSEADCKWCVSKSLGAAIGERRPAEEEDAVLIYQSTPGPSPAPLLHVSWFANLYGTGGRHRNDNALAFEALPLPRAAADPLGTMHICTRKFLDYEFPPCAASLFGQQPLKGVAPGVQWLPATQLCGLHTGPVCPQPSRTPAKLLAAAEPDAAAVGSVLAAVYEYPGFVEALFSATPDVNHMGKYGVWLCDGKAWRQVAVDDFVPGESSVPCGLWAALLEKALAKHCGSYEALRRSEPGPILGALTGQLASLTMWQHEMGWWSWWRYIPSDEAKGPGSFVAPNPEPATCPRLHERVRHARPLKMGLERIAGSWQRDEDFFCTMRELNRSNVLLFARARGPSAEAGSLGLLPRCGYSVLDLVESPEGEGGGAALRLVQLRNVWGDSAFWTGAWSQGSQEWLEFPDMRRHYLRPEHLAQDRFWMGWADFCAFFDSVEVCPMPKAARKASHELASRGRRGKHGQRTANGCSLFHWRCCTVEKAGKK